MRKIKDFFYDKNDIIIVLIILAAAAFIIYTRIGVIMDYPEQLAREAAAAETQQQQEETSSADSNIVSITIDDSATLATVSETLESEGLVSSAADFQEYVDSQTADGEEVTPKTGTFQITKGSTQEEILDIITE